MIQSVPGAPDTVDVSVLLYFTEPWAAAHLAPQPVDDGLYALPASAAVAYPGELVDHYLAMAHFTCCRLCLGLSILHHGHAWTDHTGDHLWHFLGWFYALERVLTGGPQADTTTFVWDESALRLERDGDTLTLYDQRAIQCAAERGERPATWYPITVLLWPFAAQVSAAGTVYRALLDALRRDLARRGCTPATTLTLLDGLGDLPHPAPDDIALKQAIIWRELDVTLDPLLAVQQLVAPPDPAAP